MHTMSTRKARLRIPKARECPFCHGAMSRSIKEVDYRIEYWHRTSTVVKRRYESHYCPRCGSLVAVKSMVTDLVPLEELTLTLEDDYVRLLGTRTPLASLPDAIRQEAYETVLGDPPEKSIQNKQN